MSNLEKRIQIGAVSASIFVNKIETTDGPVPVRNVVLQRTYTDKEGKFENANSYGINDLPKAIMALNKAYEHLVYDMPAKQKAEYK